MEILIFAMRMLVICMLIENNAVTRFIKLLLFSFVQFVASGSRLRLYLPKETCLITFLVAGKL